MPEDRGDALYGLPLEEFVAARDALARELRAGGDRDGAARVGKLRKPTRAAWAVNMAVREHPDAAAALTEAAGRLREAQAELLAGGDAGDLRAAGERARAAVEALVDAAPAGSADRVRSTLHAATLDPDVLADVAAGRVAREQEASGFGGLAAVTAPAGRRPPARKSAAPAPEGDAGEAEAGEAERRRVEAEREERLARARAAEAAAATDVDAARDAVTGAEERVSAAREALAEAEAALAGHRAELDEAEGRRAEAERERRAADG